MKMINLDRLRAGFLYSTFVCARRDSFVDLINFWVDLVK